MGWSDAARQAAAEARKRSAFKREGDRQKAIAAANRAKYPVKITTGPLTRHHTVMGISKKMPKK